jgi:hypothetical protein
MPSPPPGNRNILLMSQEHEAAGFCRHSMTPPGWGKYFRLIQDDAGAGNCCHRTEKLPGPGNILLLSQVAFAAAGPWKSFTDVTGA